MRPKLARVLVLALVLGAGFGAATSLVNGVVSPSDEGDLVTAVRALSLVLGAGWAWASLAVVAGGLAREPQRGALAGTAALVTATAAYYVVDSIVREEPFGWYLPELRYWWTVSLVLAPALGVVGALARRPSVIGLLARLTIPVGAAAQLAVLPPGAGSPVVTTPMSWARATLAAVAFFGAAAVIARFVQVERRRRRTRARGERRVLEALD